MTARIKWWSMATAVLAAIGLAAAGLDHSRTSLIRSRVREAAPARPDLQTFPAVLTECIAQAEQAVANGPQRASALADLARLYHANGFVPEATRCYAVLMTSEPRNPRWPHLLAAILAGSGQLDEALPLLRKTTVLAPDYAPARVRLGDVLLKLDRTAEAAQEYEATLQLGPLDPFAVLGLARCAIEREDWIQARSQLQRIVRADPDFGPAWEMLATVHHQLGQIREANAARARDSTTSPEPPDPWVEELMAFCYDPYRLAVAAAAATNGGAARRAVQLLDRAHELDPKDASIVLQLGKARARIGDAASARRHFERCIALQPDDENGWSALTTLLAAGGDLSAAERTLRAGLAQCPKAASLHLLNGRRLHSAGKLAAAAAALRESIRQRPKEAPAYVELAKVLFRLEQSEEAAATLQAALRAEPAHPEALLELARQAIASGDAAAAQNGFMRIDRQPRVKPADVAALRAAFRRKFGRDPEQ